MNLQKICYTNKSEASRRFKFGFNLNEQELRRLYDIICRQMDIVTSGNGYTTTYEIKLHNGVIANPGSIDEIIEQENIGSSAIRRLTISVVGNGNSSDIKFVMQFIDPNNEDSEDNYSIKYRIWGTDRDWVIVSDSLLDERIRRMKIFSLKPSFFRMLPMFVTQLLLIVVLLISFVSRKPEIERFALVEERWHNEEIVNFGELIIELERIRIEGSDFNFRSIISNWDVPIVIIAVFVMAISLFGESISTYLYPPYNFIWGDYIQIHKRRKSTRNFIFIVIILGIIISIIANYLYDLLKGMSVF